jgi:hypothetical protein
MEPLDASFVDIFLDFLNDKKADARKVENAFGRHEYVKDAIAKKAIGYQWSPDKAHYKEMRVGMRSKLSRLLNEIDYGKRQKQEIADQLNRLKLKVLTPNGMILEVSGIVDFEVGYKGIEPKVYYAINGVEYACWFALGIISREPEKVKTCPWLNCGNFFIGTRKKVSFCSKDHQEKAEKENKKARSWNSRHPDKPHVMPYQTIKKPRGG